MLGRKVIGGELTQVIADRAKMVVNHVEQHAEAMTMRLVDKVAKVVGRTIQTRRREQIDAVVAPAKLAIELGNRHDLERRDAHLG